MIGSSNRLQHFRAAPRRNWGDPLQYRQISRCLKGEIVVCSRFQSLIREEVISLFEQVFTDSEGPSEGKTIAGLVTEMIDTTPAEDLIGVVAHQDETLIGAIFFTRLGFADQRSGFILSPVAVASAYQKQGVGQQLINFGIELLHQHQVEIVMTYGDPSYYSKVGFMPIEESVIKAPQPLSFPHGWLAQSLTKKEVSPAKEAVSCVAALDQARYW